MFTNPLENVGTYMREGVAKFGEEMMGNMIESLLANQDNAVSQLQDLQKWNIVKLVQKLLTTRFFPREKPFVAIEDSPFLSAIDRCFSSPASVSLGNLRVRVNGADSLFLVHWRNSKLELARNVKWKVRIKFQDKVIDGPTAVLQAPEAIGAPRWIAPRIDDDPCSFPSLLRWSDSTFDLGPVYDLHSDIQIELLHRKFRDVEKLRDVVSAQAKGVSELRSFFGKDPVPSATRQPVSPRGGGAGIAAEGPSLNTDGGDGIDGDSGDEAGLKQRSRPTLSVNWTVYGRVVIPLSMWLVTSTLSRASSQTTRQTTYRSTMMTPPRMEASIRPGDITRRKLDLHSSALLLRPNLSILGQVSKSEAWYHLYPPNQQESEYKFTKPCSGYPGLGMVNPLVSLGFLHVGVEFERAHNPYLMCLISNQNPVSRTWIMPTKFDLQVFESAGLRLHHCTAFTPRWIRRFCHLGSLYYQSKDDFDTLLVCAFWVLLFTTSVLLPMYATPIGFAMIVWCVSMSYRRQPSDTSGTCYYIAPPLPVFNLPQIPSVPEAHHQAIAQAFGARSQKTKNVFQGWMETAVLNLKTPRIRATKSISKLDRELQSLQVATPHSHQRQHNNTLWSPLQPSPNTEACDKDASDTVAAAAAKSSVCAAPTVASLVMPITDIAPSSMATVFGRACIAVRDTTSYSPAFPLFADDCNDVDLLLLKHLGLLVVELVQLSSTIAVTIYEKLKFAFDWTDPFVSVVSLFIISVLAVQAALVIKAVSCLPGIVLRFFLLFVPMALVVVSTDPVISAATGLATQIDRMAINIFRWQPESALICRLCQNIWDVFYLQNLLSDADREDRHKLMAQVLDSLTERNKQKDLAATQQHMPSVIDPQGSSLSASVSALMNHGSALVGGGGGGNGVTASHSRKDWFAVFTKRKDSAPQSAIQPSTTVVAPAAPVAPTVEPIRELSIDVDDFIDRIKRRKAQNLSVVQSEAATSIRLRKKDSSQETHGAVGVRSTMTIVQEKPSDSLMEKSRSYLARLLYGLWKLIKPAVCTVALSLADGIIGVLKMEARFVVNWFLRLPDRREVEHRQIAATQFMGDDLSHYIIPRPDQLGETGTPRGGSRTPTSNGQPPPDGSTTYNKELIDFYRNANKTLSKARGHGGWTAALAPKGNIRHAAPAGTQQSQ